ncbi:MAG: hypothetical protein DRI61_00665 [Chloroflexi bacterium]|nr:MAG: hypothetical protein DRI61_00665 [Chloroflexota bacterium]
MSERVDIEIGIKVQVQELERAVQLLRELNQQLRFQNVQPQVPAQVGRSMLSAAEAAKTFDKQLGWLTRSVSDNSELIREYYGVIGQFPDINTQEAQNAIQNISRDFNVSKDDVILGVTTIRKALESVFKVPVGTREFRESVTELSAITGVESEKIEKSIMKARRSLGGFSPDVRQVANAFYRLGAAVREHRKQLHPLDAEWRQVRREMRAVRGSLGSAYYAVKQLTMQFYWLFVGLMFVAIGLQRARAASLASEVRVFSLARAYRSQREALEALEEAVREYGPSSDEARTAAMNLKEAEESLRINRERMRNAIVQEKLAFLTYYLGSVPIGINMARLVLDIYGLWIARSKILASSMVEEATAQTVSNTAKNKGFLASMKAFIGSKLLGHSVKEESAAKEVDTAATMTNTAATWSLVGAKAVLLAVATAGISIITTLATANLMQAWANQEAEKSMKEFNKEAKNFYNNIDDLIEEIDTSSSSLNMYSNTLSNTKDKVKDLEGELGPHSLRGSLLEVNKAIKEVQRNLDRGLQSKVVEAGIKIRTQTLEETPRRVEEFRRQGFIVNINFGSVVVRREEDIKRIAYEIDSAFEKYYYAMGGK